MKIVLFALNGSYAHTSLAIRCLRPPLEAEGNEVLLIEGNLRDRTSNLLHSLYAEKADIYSFSCYIWNIELMLALAYDLSKLLPSCQIIFGGPEVSFDTERFENSDFIDAIICGEGEDVIATVCKDLYERKLTKRIINASHSNSSMQKEGILYRSDDFKGKDGSRILYYESSRGCPFNCSYCLSCTTRSVHSKSALQTIEDLRSFENLDADFKIIKFVDRTFNFDIKRANEIWSALLSEKFTKKYHFEVCISLLNDESFEILSKMPKGKIQLEVGLQSTNSETLSAVSRHLDAKQTLDKCKEILSLGNIHLHLDLIAALPHETFERFGKSFDDAYFCCHQLQLGFLKLLHGTPLRENAEKYGYVFSDSPPYTVLSSMDISYEELHTLEKISFLLERYRESGRFDSCLDYAVRHHTSPFGFYLEFQEYISKSDGREIHKISQFDAYRLLYEYIKPRLTESEIAEFEHKMHTDFSQNESRKTPHFLRKKN